MSWLTPLGFLGLIGLVVWLIIYLIKPNYQHKIISSTYVWKLSLKYRKKRLPVSKLRNLLLILCQILAITGIAFALAQPFIKGEDPESNERIVVLDASADMLASLSAGGETRFDRAVDQLHELADQVAEEGGKFTLILANNAPEFVLQRVTAESIDNTHAVLDSLKDPSNYRCTYGVADVDASMKMTEVVLEENPHAQVIFYTGTTYTDPGQVKVVNVTDINEWNAAILKAEAVNVENYYEFRIDLASYGRDTSIDVYMDVYGVNDGGETVNFSQNVLCTQEMGTVTLTFGNDKERSETEQNYILTETPIFEYEYAYIHIEQNDSLIQDNTIYIYGGKKPPLNIQYYSTLPNPFYRSVLMALRDTLDDRWDINLTEVYDLEGQQKIEPALEGFDVYIFEHTMPDMMPTDGLVILANPDTVPNGGGFYLGTTFQGTQEVFLTGGDEPSPLMNGIKAENISLTKYTQITMFDGGYVPLLYCGKDPVMLAMNEENGKVVVITFSLHYSNLPIIKEFPMMLYNMLETYVPSTITQHLYEVSDTVQFKCRSPLLELDGPGVKQQYEKFPGELYVTTPGVYTLIQTPINGVQVVENFYVKIPAGESNIKLVVDTLTNPYFEPVDDETDVDLVFWFAMALVALLFCEWWLQSKEYF